LATRLDRENNEALYAYAQFIGETGKDVLHQLVETMLAKDKEFVAWRAEHPDSYVPLPDRERRKQQAMKADRARLTPLRHAVTHAAKSSAVAG
jgi:hypothetical protein